MSETQKEQMFSTFKDKIHIITLLVVGFILRFVISITHSYSSDELSAINRLNIDGFDNIINQAVKNGDFHPAGVQLFEEFWVGLFGDSEVILRFPFVVLGVLSIYLTFQLGKTYLSKNAGLIAALLLTLTYFPILNSELARPYSPGLFFSLLVAWFWFKVININTASKNTWLNVIGLGLSYSLAMYTHYFAFMFVGFIGLTGFLFIKKQTLIPYLVSGFLGVLLFLPHLNITIFHLSIEGGLGWLGKPTNDWLIRFLYYVFNNSWLVISAIVVLGLVTFYKPLPIKQKLKKSLLIFCIWFFGIYILGHLFSLTSSSILKFPIMLFPLPFLFLLIGGLFTKVKPSLFNVLFSLLFLTIITSTIVEKDLFGNKHFGVLKEMAEPMVGWNEKYGSENISTFFNVNNPNYLNYYAAKIGDSLSFDQDVIEFNGDIEIREKLFHLNTDYCIIGYSHRLTLPQVYETCKEFYPVIIDYVKLNNCAVFLLAKKGNSTIAPQSYLIEKFSAESSLKSHQSKSEIESNWTINPSQLKTEINKDSYYLSDQNNSYGPSIVFNKKAIEVSFPYYLKISIEASNTKKTELTATLTATRNGVSVVSQNRSNIWLGHDLETIFKQPTETNKASISFPIPIEIKDTDDIKISLWNRNGSPVKIHSITIEAVENIWN